MHYGSKGWYVAELKSRGSRTMREESFKAIKPIFLPTCLKQRKTILNMAKPRTLICAAFFYSTGVTCPFFHKGRSPAFR